MALTPCESLEEALRARRSRLRRALSRDTSARHVVSLIQRVDRALDELESDAFGRCVACGERLSDDHLACSPLAEYCLCHLTDAQRRELERDLGLAGRLQSGLLPDPDLSASGWHAHYHYEPASVVGGDTCDLIHRASDGDVFFSVADVSGKGVAASLLMTHLQAALRTLVDSGTPLARIVTRVNERLVERTPPEQFATLVCGRATPEGRIELVNAGHASPLVVRSGVVEALPPTGIPVGMLGDSSYETLWTTLAPGDALLVHTDGLTEASRRDGTVYEPRLRAAVARGRDRGSGERDGTPARALVRHVRDDLRAFLSGGCATDDLTILALARSGS